MSWPTITGATIIAASIALTNHWQIIPLSNEVMAMRLNKWTGSIQVCMIDRTTIKPNTLSGAIIKCSAD
jgi:hypothetical protein